MKKITKTYYEYNELSKELQEKVFNDRLNELLEAVASGAISFDDEKNKDKLQYNINKCIEKAEKLQTPWFIGEILLENKTIKDALEGMARCDAENSLYAEGDAGRMGDVNVFYLQGIKGKGASNEKNE